MKAGRAVVSEPASASWLVRRREILLDHTLVMGILNVTPDSFSDGGRYLAPDRALQFAQEMVEAGADIIDVGGESTRPGSLPVGADDEIARVAPVIGPLAARGIVVSVDTMKTEVARAAIEAGAAIVNDVTALAAEGMAEVCAATGVGVVLAHMAGDPRTMQLDPTYEDVVTEVATFLSARAAAAILSGIDSRSIVVDPGIGFGKTVAHNLALIARLDRLAALDWPVLVGTSRKSFLGAITGREVGDRDTASAVTSAVAAIGGAAVIRVHNVADGRDAARLADAMVRSGSEQ